MKRYPEVAGYILAGGVSSRMGVDKGLLDFDGVPLLVHTARLLEPLVTQVTVVGSPKRYAAFPLETIADDVVSQIPNGRDKHGRGPLAGIATALSTTHSPWNLIIACDMPYLSPQWLEWLLSRALRSSAEALVPQSPRGLEPLAAVYRCECKTVITAALARGVRRMTDAISELQLEIVDSRQWRHVDSANLVLNNMNTPEDYENALTWRRANKVDAGATIDELPRSQARARQSVRRPHK